jgi:hypothetical protein
MFLFQGEPILYHHCIQYIGWIVVALWCLLVVIFRNTYVDQKEGAQHTWKAWRTKEVNWGPSPSNPHVLHQATTSLLAQRWKEIKANTFWTLDCFSCELQYTGDTHNARTLIPMNTRMRTLSLGASSKTRPANPQDWRSHHRHLVVDGNITYHWKQKRH